MVKTGTQQSQNKGPQGRRCKVWKGEILLCCRMNQVIAQVGWCFSLGKPSAQQEDDSIKVLAGRLRYESWGWGSPVYCVLLQLDCGFMNVLYCSILGKLDLGWGITAFLNSCVDRWECWKIPVSLKFITSCFNLKDNAVSVVKCLSSEWSKSLTWPHSLSQQLLLKEDIRVECFRAAFSCENLSPLSKENGVSWHNLK